jgi:putative Mg2+ transporter-C (MgtC) family protein
MVDYFGDKSRQDGGRHLITEWELLLRLALSCVLGGIIGYEREVRHKSAGLRTNVLVCLGSCLIMVLSQTIYLQVEGKTNADPARLAAQVVSGIGFLGAGAIMKEGLTVIGLTTAACLWVVAGVGLAVGLGCYTGALLTTGLVFVTLGTLQRLDGWMSHESEQLLIIHAIDQPGQIVHISQCLEDIQLVVHGVKVREDDDSSGPERVCIELAIYNHRDIKGAVIMEAVRQVQGVIGAEIKEALLK